MVPPDQWQTLDRWGCRISQIWHRLNGYLAEWVTSPPGKYTGQNCTLMKSENWEQPLGAFGNVLLNLWMAFGNLWMAFGNVLLNLWAFGNAPGSVLDLWMAFGVERHYDPGIPAPHIEAVRPMTLLYTPMLVYIYAIVRTIHDHCITYIKHCYILLCVLLLLLLLLLLW